MFFFKKSYSSCLSNKKIAILAEELTLKKRHDYGK